jgi:hypothetical protein
MIFIVDIQDFVWNCIQLIQMEWVFELQVFLISCEKTNRQNFRKLLFQIIPYNNATIDNMYPLKTDDSKTFC